MSKKTKNKTTVQQPAASRRPRWWIAGVIVVTVVAAMAGYGLWGKYAAAGPDTLKLIGQWQRPDGGYVLELSIAAPEGQLNAAYFNPRPINVARADWKLQDGRLLVFVELRDVNYPGSTYTLNYDAATDRLIGKYFQAVAGETYDIEFLRKGP